MHMDGARLWNAIVASGIPAREWGKHFDSVSVCFSKGLGAPIGSAVAGTKDFIARARRVRKLYGGHMRQVGILAAAAIYALDHHLDRLVEDHRNAKLFADAVRDSRGLRLDPDCVESNLVWFDVDPDLMPAPTLAARFRERNVLVHIAGPRTLRVCTHLDVSSHQVATAAELARLLCK